MTLLPCHSRPRRIRHPDCRGFTLLELILAITLVGILAAFSLTFLIQPVRFMVESSLRAEQVDTADMAMSLMTRELRGALPNSIRIHTDENALEFIPVLGAGRYQRYGQSALNVTAKEGDFGFHGFIPTDLQNACNSDCRISIYNTGQTGMDAYYCEQLARVSKIHPDRISFEEAAFRTHSPQQRFYLVRHAVKYVCDKGELRRRTFTLCDAPKTPTDALLATGVKSCDFSYNPMQGLVKMELNLSHKGQPLSLFTRVQVLNAP
ncbi:type II secretion system protein [Ectothiorhodospira shaposhnikovii]|uniref:type II secretion system protein n=1 Tax=Ectothiorhodospira shaposhnikovii TaxID=1054 RepID=UPI001EE86474|nr:type II secretion system protein [Ectothiorhodospira shaposhnikovii]MCG5514379.1 type II secretion system GspH family protein [Ectothiorhodospira shaposhnikovii]